MGMFNSSKHNKFSMLSSNLFTNNYHKALTKQNCPSYLPKPHTHENQVRKKSTQTWNFEVPRVEMRFTTPKMPSFRDFASHRFVCKGWSFNGVSMEDEEERKSNVRERERELLKCGLSEERERELLFSLKRFFPLFLLFYFKLCHMSPFEWSQKGPTFLLMWPIHSHRKWEKSDLWNAKILPRFACRFSGSSSSRFSASGGVSFLKVGNIYIKTLRIKPRAWFRGWFR